MENSTTTTVDTAILPSFDQLTAYVVPLTIASIVLVVVCLGAAVAAVIRKHKTYQAIADIRNAVCEINERQKKQALPHAPEQRPVILADKDIV